MNNIFHFLCLAAFLVFSLPVNAVFFKRIGGEEGLSQLSVLSIHQDRLGRMWFGTAEGLNIYDGKEMVTLKGGDHVFDTNIRRNVIEYITEDAASNIWFVADDALIRYEIETDRVTCIEEQGVLSAVAVDGKIYITTEKGEIWYWDELEKTLKPFEELARLPHNTYYLHKNREGIWWAATDEGLFRQNGKNAWQAVISDTFVRHILESHDGCLWISTSKGLYKREIDGTFVQFTHYPGKVNSLVHDEVRCVTEDNSGNLWIGTFKGLNKYSPREDCFELYAESDLPGSLPNSSVYSLLKDRQGNIWVGTYYGGASVFTPEYEFFRYYSGSYWGEGRLNYPLVGRLVEDKRGDLWICTDGGGLNHLDVQTQRIETFCRSGMQLKSNNLKSICYDSIRDRLYFAMYQNGMECYDIQRKKFEECLPNVVNGYSHRNVIRVVMYRDEVMFLSGSGLFSLHPQTGKVNTLFAREGCTELFVGKRGFAYVIMNSEVIKVDLGHPHKLESFDLSEYGSGFYDLLCLCELPDGRLFVGTQGAGIFGCDADGRNWKRYTAAEHKLLSDYCYSMAVSAQGELVALGDKGLSFFNPTTGKMEYSVMKSKLPVAAFNHGNELLVDSKGNIFTGSTNGLLMIAKEQVRWEAQQCELYFSALQVNNRKISPNDDTGILNRNIGFTDAITLAHDRNNIVVNFADNNFGNASLAFSYEYRLEGLEEEWIADNGSQRIVYTSLSPGDYVLRVRTINEYANLPSKEISLKLRIRPPLYNSAGAWCVYVLLSVLLIIYIRCEYHRRAIHREALERERMERRNMEELNRFKFDFFTNISHELRTPLTLIITQVDLLLNSKGLTDVARGKIKKLGRQARYMHELITEQLDFYKLDQTQLQLKCEVRNLIPLIDDVCASFREKAVEREVEYHCSFPSTPLCCNYDPMQLRKVFFNLLSNAFKYTEKGGKVEVLVAEDNDEVVVRIVDTGIGIPADDLENIFERFYRTEMRRDIIGAGIGLALTKEIVELHGGRITVESKPGYGSVFTVRLKKEATVLPLSEVDIPEECALPEAEACPEEISEEPDAPKALLCQEEAAAVISELQEGNGKEQKRYSILIVEDEEELLETLCELFGGLYRVLKARNGKEGLEQTRKHLPDIILSDVMMPEMDGIEMCTRIRSDVKTCHIPLLMLTAANSSERQMQGLRFGADDYLCKPFDTKILLLKVSTILRNRCLVKNILEKESKVGHELLGRNEQEQQWIRKMETIVERHLDDNSFDVNRLTEELGISRALVFKRMKDLLKMTPADFIQSYRLKKAAILLLDHPDYQLEDIALQLGFSSGRYFSRCFKDYFQLSPQQYRRQYLSTN